MARRFLRRSDQAVMAAILGGLCSMGKISMFAAAIAVSAVLALPSGNATAEGTKVYGSVTVQTRTLLIRERDVGFHGSVCELRPPHAWRKIDHVFRRMDAHPLQHIDQVGVDVDAV